MKTNIIYDFIIIGASLEGIKLANELTTKLPNKKTLIISSEITPKDLANSLPNLLYLKAKVILSEFIHGLHKLYIKSTSNSDILSICGLHIIIATGACHKKLNTINYNKIYYRLEELPKLSKNKQIIVVGNNQEAVAAALYLSKKVKYVYLCNSFATLNCNNNLKTKLKSTSNIAYLEYSNIIDYKTDKQNQLTSVILDTFGQIHCTEIIAFLGKTYNDFGIDSFYMEYTNTSGLPIIDTDGRNTNCQILIKNNCETTKIPTIYAVGECAFNYNAAAGKRLVKHLMSKF